jgi:hypothetical protein
MCWVEKNVKEMDPYKNFDGLFCTTCMAGRCASIGAVLFPF